MTPERDFEAEIRSLACGDSSCRLVTGPRGMATNGGCRCVGERSWMAAFQDPEGAKRIVRVLDLRRQQVGAREVTP